MIKKIKLTNIKKHAELEVNFSEGVNVIVGPNYSGKSSILHGVLFGLFGIRAVPGNTENFWTDETGTSSVELEFEVSGKLVDVRRTRSTASLSEDGAKVASGTTAVNSRMAELMGITMADFLLIKYSRQKETANLLTFGATNLNGLIERVGGISIIKKAMEQLTTIASSSKGVLSIKSRVELPPLNEAIAETRLALFKGEEEAKGLEAELIELEKTYTAAEVEYKEARGRLAVLDRHLADKARVEATISSELAVQEKFRDKLDALPAVTDKDLADRREYADMLADKVAEQASAALRRRKLNRFIGATAEALVEAEKRVSEVKAAREAKQTYALTMPSVEAAQRDKAEAGDAYREAKRRAQALLDEIDSGQCSECGRPFEDGWDLEMATIQATNAQKAESRMAGALLSADREYRHIEETNSALSALVANLTKAEDTLSALHTRQGEYERELESLLPQGVGDVQEATLEEARAAERSASKTVADRENLIQAIDDSVAAVASAKIKLSGLEACDIDNTITEDVVESLRAEHEGAVEAHHTAELALSDCQHTCEGLKRRYEDAVHYRDTAREDNEMVADHEKRLSDATGLKKFLTDNREEFMHHTWDQLLSHASTLCNNATGGAMSSMQREGYLFSYTEEGRNRALSAASGGQESLMGLALKVALSESIPDSLSCLLLDEVTADLDEPHSSAVTALLGSVGCQIITVSHRDMDRSGAYNVIQLGER